MGDVAEEMKQKILKLAIHEDLWGQLGEDASNKLRALIAKVLQESSDGKVKREAGEDEEELSVGELLAVGTIIDDMEKTGASKSKVDKLGKILSTLENGSEKLKDALDSDSVKSVWKSVCEKARDKSIVPPTNVPKEKKTIGYKMCSEKAYAKMQNILTKGNSAIAKINEYFSPENIKLGKKLYNKLKDLRSKG